MSRILLSFCLFVLLTVPATLSADEPEAKSLKGQKRSEEWTWEKAL